MPIEVAPIIARLQTDVPVAEAILDDAMIAVLSLTTSVVTARRDTAGVPAAKGHAMIQRLAKAQMSLVDISGDVRRVHGELVTIGRETAGYDLHQDCPERKSAVLPLHAVA